MKLFQYIFLFLAFSGFAQDPIGTIFIKKAQLHADSFIGIDNFETLYFVTHNEIFKKAGDKILNYNNLQLGEVSSANSFNPLKINVFYKDFNTVVILDNRLAEVFKIDFNVIQPNKNVTHISTGFDNTIWICNLVNNQLELYNYKTNKSLATTLPILSDVLDLKSNFNVCWLLTENYLYAFNYFGSLLSKIENDGYTSLCENNGNIVLKKENALYYLKKDSRKIQHINLPELLIKQFSVTNERLYIYDEEFLHEYQLKTN